MRSFYAMGNRAYAVGMLLSCSLAANWWSPLPTKQRATVNSKDEWTRRIPGLHEHIVRLVYILHALCVVSSECGQHTFTYLIENCNPNSYYLSSSLSSVLICLLPKCLPAPFCGSLNTEYVFISKSCVKRTRGPTRGRNWLLVAAAVSVAHDGDWYTPSQALMVMIIPSCRVAHSSV